MWRVITSSSCVVTFNLVKKLPHYQEMINSQIEDNFFLVTINTIMLIDWDIGYNFKSLRICQIAL